MNKKIGVVIAAILLMGCATPGTADVITGYTVDDAPACEVDNLSTESMDLISLWWLLNKKLADGTITDEEYAQGLEIYGLGQCGLLRGGVPVTIVLLDGTIYLLRFPDGSLRGVVDSGFTETAPRLEGKEYRIDEE